MDIGPFEDWLLSLAAVSRLNIEIWHTGGPAFFSSPVSEEFMVFKEASHFASQVMTRAEFQHAVFQNRHEAFGVPFRDQQRQIGALIAYCENGDRQTAASSCDSANPVGVREMEIFLKRLAALMEDKWAAENEIHGLTTERRRR